MMRDRYVSLAHGNGGRHMRALIEEVFARPLAHPGLDLGLDAAPLPLPPDLDPVITTDAFTVNPLEFPGGTIGTLAVNGTVNDLAVSGARPLYLTLSAIIEEGLEVAQLARIAESLAAAARAAGVSVVAGDTKVVPRGTGGGLYLVTTGVGVRPRDLRLGLERIAPGDVVLLSGPVGDHGIAVMLAREEFGLKGALRRDCASIAPLAAAAAAHPGLRFMRDPTRGGLATVLHEIAQATSMDIRVREADVPVREEVRAVCEILGYDPFYLACEGRVVAVAARADAEAILAAWRGLAGGAAARAIGVVEEGSGTVVLETALGGERVLEELEDDPLPRIC